MWWAWLLVLGALGFLTFVFVMYVTQEERHEEGEK